MARIRDSIGDLMTDEQLAAILAKGIEKAFFETRLVKKGYHDEVVPCLVDQCIDRYLKDRMWRAVDEWIKDHPEVVEAKVRDAIDAGVARCLFNTLDNRFSGFLPLLLEGFKQNGII